MTRLLTHSSSGTKPVGTGKSRLSKVRDKLHNAGIKIFIGGTVEWAKSKLYRRLTWQESLDRKSHSKHYSQSFLTL